jgi:tetratricopeptide (TPR) repeat protein
MNFKKSFISGTVIIFSILIYYSCSTFLRGEGTNKPVNAVNDRVRLVELSVESKDLLGESYEYALLGKMSELDGNLGAAVENYKKGLKSDPKSSFLCNKIGEIYFAVSDFDKSLEYLNKSISLDPNNLDSYLARGEVYLKKGESAKAESDFLKALNLDPDVESANIELGELFFDKKEYDKAIEYFKKVLKVNPQSFIALREMGFVYLELKMIDNSIEDLTKALELNPFDRKVVLLLSYAYEEAKKFKECVNALNNYLRFFPTDYELTTRLNDILLHTDEPMNAIGSWKRYISTGVVDDRAHFQLAVLYERLGQFAFAETELKKTIELNPKNFGAKNYLGYMYADRGTNLDEATKLVSEALKGEPENGSFLDSMGWVYFKKDNFDKAEKFLLKALKKLPDDPTINEHLGDIYFKMGNYDKAIGQWERALQIDPNNTDIQKKLLKLEK